jgi:hypothetical protein
MSALRLVLHYLSAPSQVAYSDTPAGQTDPSMTVLRHHFHEHEREHEHEHECAGARTCTGIPVLAALFQSLPSSEHYHLVAYHLHKSEQDRTYLKCVDLSILSKDNQRLRRDLERV